MKLSDASAVVHDLPIETKATTVSAYIPNERHFDTDGQIFLQSDLLFNESVPRVFPCPVSVAQPGDEEGRRYAQAHARAVPFPRWPPSRDVRLRT